MNLSHRSAAQRYPVRIGTLVVPTDPYWIQAFEAITKENQKIGDDLVVLQPAATMQALYAISTDEMVDQILAHELDVLITTLVSAPVMDAVLSEGLPVICLSELSGYQHPLFTAMSSLYDGGKMAGQFIGARLGGKGHALCISAGLEQIITTGQSRLQGFQEGLAAFPGVSSAHIPSYWEYNRAYLHLLEVFKHYPRPMDAIFGVSDAIILAARDAGRSLGRVTDQTVLVGLNGDPMALASVAAGTLTATVDTASELLGAMAVRLAHQAGMGLRLPGVVQQNFFMITRENVASIATRKLSAIADIPTQMVGYSRQQEHDRLSQLEISMEITRQIGSLMDRNRLFQVISDLVFQHYGYDWMRILRWSEKEQGLVLYEGALSPASQQIPIEQDQLLLQVFLSQEMVYIPDLRTSRRWHTGKEWETIRSRAVLPIELGAQVIGILDLQSSRSVRQLSLEIVGLELLARQLGIVIQNMDLYQEALQARAYAERANQLKARLTANVGHEMRSPLNSILGFSQSLQKKLETGQPIAPEMLAQDLGHIYRSGEHLMYMINDLLDLSRAEIGELNLYFEPIQPAPLLREIFGRFANAETTAAQLQWVLDIPDRLPTIRADVVRLGQVLNNLLANAAKYTRQGSITLGAAVELPFLHLWVQDTGQGVPVELQEKIFEPFATSGRRRRPEGIGLGLSITRHLVSLHDGLITLESQPGSGSTFHVYLPLPGVTPETPLAAPVDGKGILLVVSAQAQLPAEIWRICERQSLTPQFAATRDHLKQVLAEGSIRAIAWDLAHAASNEWSLIYRLGAHPQCAALPVILYGLEENGGQPAPGLTNVLFKPCNGNTLKDWIHPVAVDPGENANKILIVDDDPQARQFCQALLQEFYPERQVLLAENGQQALDLLKTEVPAMILLDLLMPVVDGFAVLEQVRGDIRTQRIPVIVMSGKLLSYEDIQRLNYYKTVFYTKGILTPEETARFFGEAGCEARSLPHPTSLIIKQSLAFLHQNYSRPITRKEIADAVGVSENYLSQIFRQEISLSPWDYLSRLRIQKARDLLLHTQHTITQIASQVGFNDSAYFSRVFHKATGQSPLEYRQNQQ